MKNTENGGQSMKSNVYCFDMGPTTSGLCIALYNSIMQEMPGHIKEIERGKADVISIFIHPEMTNLGNEWKVDIETKRRYEND